jgi:anaerobic C4-dicarboxylate transporter
MRAVWMERAERETREEECEHMIAAYEGERFAIFNALESQFHTLQIRAQVVLGICGVLLTVSVLMMTGKLIIAGRTETQLFLASRFLIIAGVLDVLSGAVAVVGVLRIRWMTPPTQELRAWVMTRLAHRAHKTAALHLSIALLVMSMILYQAAAAIMLVQL